MKRLPVMLPFRLNPQVGTFDRSSGGGLFVWQTGLLLLVAFIGEGKKAGRENSMALLPVWRGQRSR